MSEASTARHKSKRQGKKRKFVVEEEEHVRPGQLNHVPKSFQVATEPPPWPDVTRRRAVVVPDRLPCRLRLDIDKKTYYHEDVFDLFWQQNGQVQMCRNLGEKHIKNKEPPERTYYLRSERYSIMQHIPLEDATRLVTAESYSDVEKELFTQDITATAAWEEDLPFHVARHLVADKNALLYLQIELCYDSFITKKPCNSLTCQCADDIGGETGDLCENGIKSYDDQRWFLSGKFLNEFFHIDLIQHLIYQDKKLPYDSSWIAKSSAEKERFVTDVNQFMVRIFATCLFARISLLHVLHLHDSDKVDAHIPIPKDSLPSKWNGSTRTAFHRHQFRFKAHMFIKPENLSDICEVAEGTFMPFTLKEPIGEGASGEVFHVRIHELHHALTEDKRQDFAMKVIKRHNNGESYFRKELEVCDELSRNPDKHITPIITAWQDKNSFYLLFPKARLDLHEFLLRTKPATKSDSIEWLLKQMRGLARGLEYIHNPPITARSTRRQDNEEGSVNLNRRRRVGRHRDLKPHNILVFSEDNILKIGDFGLAVIREALSRMPRNLNSKPEVGDRDYGAPENSKDGSALGRGDLWSLGCVYLEMLLWFFRYPEDITQFRERRLKDVPESAEFKDGAFWTLDHYGKAVLREVVKERFAWLRREAKSKRVLRELVELVEEDIMNPHNPAERFSAPQISSELKGLLSRARHDLDGRPNFYEDQSLGRGTSAPGAPSSIGDPTSVGDNDYLQRTPVDEPGDIVSISGSVLHDASRTQLGSQFN